MSLQRRWPEALSLWATLKSQHPSNLGVQLGIEQILERALADQANAEPSPFEVPPSLFVTEPEEEGEPLKHMSLLRRFESLGDTCEFGMVQRMFKVDIIGLLRWASTAPDDLVCALDSDLAGVGELEHTIIGIDRDEYYTQDRRYYMRAHTFTLPSSEPIDIFSVEQCRRIQWLRRKLIQDMTSASRIFVYKSETGMSDQQAGALHSALARYNPENILFCIRLEDETHPARLIECIHERLYIGYTDRFSTVNISVDNWIALCNALIAGLEKQLLRRQDS
jgi:hypothetical protein